MLANLVLGLNHKLNLKQTLLTNPLLTPIFVLRISSKSLHQQVSCIYFIGTPVIVMVIHG